MANKKSLVSNIPDNKVHVAHMEPTRVLLAPGRLHVGPMNLAIRDVIPFVGILFRLKLLHEINNFYKCYSNIDNLYLHWETVRIATLLVSVL